MNCLYCNNEINNGVDLIVRHSCDKCFGKPSFHDWNKIDYDEFILTDLDVEFSIQLNHEPYLVYFNPATNYLYIYKKAQHFITVKANEIITPANVLQVTQRVLNMKVFI